jgi:hypothetical protein
VGCGDPDNCCFVHPPARLPAVRGCCRYWLQAAKELLPGWVLMKGGARGVLGIDDHIRQSHALKRVGVDSSLIGIDRWKALLSASCELVPLAPTANLVDAVWGADRPPIPDAKIVVFVSTPRSPYPPPLPPFAST